MAETIAGMVVWEMIVAVIRVEMIVAVVLPQKVAAVLYRAAVVVGIQASLAMVWTGKDYPP